MSLRFQNERLVTVGGLCGCLKRQKKMYFSNFSLSKPPQHNVAVPMLINASIDHSLGFVVNDSFMLTQNMSRKHNNQPDFFFWM